MGPGKWNGGGVVDHGRSSLHTRGVCQSPLNSPMRFWTISDILPTVSTSVDEQLPPKGSAVLQDAGVVPLPGMPPNLAPEKGRYPWSAAFLAFCKGFTVPQISGVYGIPERTLEARAVDEHWAALASELTVAKTPSQATRELKASLEDLEANRSKNLRVFERLRNVLSEKITQLERGELKIVKPFFSARTGEVTTAEIDPAPADLVQIAQAAKLVAEGTYRALGDAVAAEGVAGGKVSSGDGTRQITIYLPTLVAGGTGKRAPWDSPKPVINAEIIHTETTT